MRQLTLVVRIAPGGNVASPPFASGSRGSLDLGHATGSWPELKCQSRWPWRVRAGQNRSGRASIDFTSTGACTRVSLPLRLACRERVAFGGGLR